MTNNKPLAKQRLRAEGLPTADWATIRDAAGTVLPPPYIIKAVWEHASVGLDDHAVIAGGEGDTVVEQIASRSRQLGRECFAERFIEGREFNLSLVAGGDEPHVLPPAEIDFSAFPEGKPRIVGYAAKWEAGTLEYEHTPRRFDFPPDDAPLLDWLRTLAVQCWKLFELRGYARVDFRVDAQGRPWILEVNANPCLSPDAGFAAALARAGVPLERAIEWIIEDGRRPRFDPTLTSARGASLPGVSGISRRLRRLPKPRNLFPKLILLPASSPPASSCGPMLAQPMRKRSGGSSKRRDCSARARWTWRSSWSKRGWPKGRHRVTSSSSPSRAGRPSATPASAVTR